MTSLHIYLSYRDAAAALSWLDKAFGFETAVRYANDAGVVVHAEARRDAATIIVFDDEGAGHGRLEQRGDTVGAGVYLAVESPASVDSVWERATAAGATPVWEPGTTEWGNYRCRVLDPEGREWTFGTYRPGAPTGEW